MNQESTDMYRGRGRIITGDPFVDDLDLEKPEHLRRAIELVLAAGREVPKVLEAELARLKHEAEVAKARPVLLAELERVRADERLAKQRAEQERTVTFPDEPHAADDWVVIGRPIEAAPGNEWRWAEQESAGTVYRFHPHQQIHYVPAKLAASKALKLPGRVLRPPSFRLVGPLRQACMSPAAPGKRLDGTDASDFPIFDSTAFVRELSRIAEACTDPKLLGIWLEEAQAGADEAGQVAVRILTARLTVLQAEAAA